MSGDKSIKIIKICEHFRIYRFSEMMKLERKIKKVSEFDEERIYTTLE